MKENHIGIIGAAGFLGTRLRDRLNRSAIRYSAFDIDDSHADISFIDVEDPKSFDSIKNCTHIINLAAIHRDDVRPISRYDEVNVMGAKNICNAVKKYNINNIIFTSSVAIYGFAPSNTDEGGEPNYFNDYGRTKYLAENEYIEWFNENPSEKSLTIIRPTVIFGEGNRGNVFNLLRQIASKRFVMLGGGKNIKSMAYVENVAAFIEHLITQNNDMKIYNYIDKPDMDMNMLVSTARKKLFGKNNVGIRIPKFIGVLLGYMADLISNIVRKSLPVSSIRVKKFMSTSQFDSSIEETGFTAPVKLDDALKRTLEYEFMEDNSENKTFYTE
jgi:GlcNAc-P-P-Und epimerase